MIAVGIGFRGAATRDSLQDALARVLAQTESETFDALVTESAKSRAPVYQAFARECGVPGLGVRLGDMQQMITPTQSQRIQDAYGTGSLAEAAALVAAGASAELVVARVISGDGMATAALARSWGETT